MSRVWDLAKLLLSLLEILIYLGTQFSVIHRGCVDIFWNSQMGSGATSSFSTNEVRPGHPYLSKLSGQTVLPYLFEEVMACAHVSC